MKRYRKAAAASVGAGVGGAIGTIVGYIIEITTGTDLPQTVEDAIAVLCGFVAAGLLTYLAPANETS
jgi:hypothetical protein